MPAWEDAGLRGKPYCQLELIWRDDGQGRVATVYLPLPGSGENRALIVSSSQSAHFPATVPRLHWLDSLTFRSFKVRQAVVVTPNGDWSLLTLPPPRASSK